MRNASSLIHRIGSQSLISQPLFCMVADAVIRMYIVVGAYSLSLKAVGHLFTPWISLSQFAPLAVNYGKPPLTEKSVYVK